MIKEKGQQERTWKCFGCERQHGPDDNWNVTEQYSIWHAECYLDHIKSVKQRTE